MSKTVTGASSVRLTTRPSIAPVEASRTADSLHEEHLAPFGINARQLAVLLFLDGREPESQQEAAQRLGVDRTTMVALLDVLERKGLVARRQDAQDRRRNVVELTEEGRTTLARAMRASDEAEQQLLVELDAEEASQLRLLLGRLATAGTRS